jgi:hypothetical protein
VELGASSLGLCEQFWILIPKNENKALSMSNYFVPDSVQFFLMLYPDGPLLGRKVQLTDKREITKTDNFSIFMIII